MPTPVTRHALQLPADPSSAAKARRFVREQAGDHLDSMRLTEADLLVTELVANVIRHAPDAADLSLSTELTQDGLRVEVAHEHPAPLVEPTPGVGFTLLDRVALDWGHHFDGSQLTVWFVLRTPGAVSMTDEIPDSVLAATLSEDSGAHSDELVRRHSDLALSIARRYRNKGIPDDDLKQVALMALLKAIQRFDPERGDIRPYAAVTISGELKKLLRDHGWSVRVPRSMQERSLEVAKAKGTLSQELKRDPEPAEIAAKLGLTEEEVTEALDTRKAYTSKSIDRPSPIVGTSLLERLEEVDETLAHAENRAVLEEAISELPERERWILDLRFNEDMTQSEIAEIVGVSQMHVSRLLARSIEEIRQRLDT